MDSIRAKLAMDLTVWADGLGRERTPRLAIRLALIEPGFQLALSIRLQELVGRIPRIGTLCQRIVWYVTCLATGSDVDPDARIGGGIFFPHPYGVVIGQEARLGRRVTILQGVTVGRKRPDTGMPTIGDGVTLGAGAAILGPITLGDDVMVGANAVVLTDVPAGHRAVGVPARVLPPESP